MLVFVLPSASIFVLHLLLALAATTTFALEMGLANGTRTRVFGGILLVKGKTASARIIPLLVKGAHGIAMLVFVLQVFRLHNLLFVTFSLQTIMRFLNCRTHVKFIQYI